MNHATRTIAATLGVIFAISGMSHGLFEILQGNTPTNGAFIEAISESMRMWPHGNEMAFTLMPTFLIAGIASIAVSLTIIVWSLRYLHTRHGATIYLLLFVLLFLVGGGIAQVAFFAMLGNLLDSQERIEFLLVGTAVIAGCAKANVVIAVSTWDRGDGTYPLLVISPSSLLPAIIGRTTIWMLDGAFTTLVTLLIAGLIFDVPLPCITT